MDLEAQYNPRIAVPDFQIYLDRSAELAARARADLPCALDQRYGDGPLETADVFGAAPPGQDRPVHLFLHGGYWRALDKDLYSHLARPLVRAGAVAVIANYDLCPAVTVDAIVEAVRRCVAWCVATAPKWGGDPGKLTLSGHSAGAHLGAMALVTDWRAHGLDGDPVRAACLISGIYDPAPVLRISVNTDVRLTPEMAARNAPLTQPPSGPRELVVAVGGAEPPAWHRQSADYVAACARNDCQAWYLEVPRANHFDIVEQMEAPEAPPMRAILEQLRGLDPRIES